MDTATVYLFPSPPPEGQGAGGDMMRALCRAMALDCAERLAGLEGLRVALIGTPEGGAAGDVESPAAVACLVPEGESFPERVREAARSFYRLEPGGRLVMLFGRNPLLSPAEVTRAVHLLEQEDDAIVYASSAGVQDPAVLLMATRRFHGEVYEAFPPGGWEPGVQAMIAADALVVPLRPLRDVRGWEDLPWLLHEVERALLLGTWYPVRTYDVLQAMRDMNLIAEEP